MKKKELFMDLIGIDIGGTKISVCIGDEHGKIKKTHRIPTQSFNGSENGIQAIFELIDQLLKENDLSIKKINAIGISCPGPVSVEFGMLLNPPNLKGWENTEIVALFKKRFAVPVFMNNDANAAVVAEWEFGSAKKTPNLVYLTASTGMGGGIIIDNKLLQGKTDTAGEVGHFILDIKGPPCACGQHGCFEAFCGGASIANRVKEEIKRNKTSTLILDEVSGDIEKISMISIIEAMKKNDSLALFIWDEFIERLAQGIGIILMTLNPDAIILGTIAIHTKSLLLEPLKRKLPRFCWSAPLLNCRIEASILGESISELSSLALAINGLRKSE